MVWESQVQDVTVVVAVELAAVVCQQVAVATVMQAEFLQKAKCQRQRW
jgi:hypothetical protein